VIEVNRDLFRLPEGNEGGIRGLTPEMKRTVGLFSAVRTDVIVRAAFGTSETGHTGAFHEVMPRTSS